MNFHGESRRNDTHQSTTDPEAMLHRKGKGKEAKLAYLGHVLLDNRQGLVANVCATHATGTAEREAAALVLEASAPPGSTVGVDKGYDVASFVATVRVLEITPHVAQKARWSAIDGRTTRHASYHVSQRKRKLVEQVFGWMKTVGGLRKLRHRGVDLVDWQLTFAATLGLDRGLGCVGGDSSKALQTRFSRGQNRPQPPRESPNGEKPRDKSLDPHLAAAPPKNHSKHRGFVPDSPALSRIVPHPKTFVRGPAPTTTAKRASFGRSGTSVSGSAGANVWDVLEGKFHPALE